MCLARVTAASLASLSVGNRIALAAHLTGKDHDRSSNHVARGPVYVGMKAHFAASPQLAVVRQLERGHGGIEPHVKGCRVAVQVGLDALTVDATKIWIALSLSLSSLSAKEGAREPTGKRIA